MLSRRRRSAGQARKRRCRRRASALALALASGVWRGGWSYRGGGADILRRYVLWNCRLVLVSSVLSVCYSPLVQGKGRDEERRLNAIQRLKDAEKKTSPRQRKTRTS